MLVEVRAGAAVADAITRAFAQFRPPPGPDRTGSIAALREIARRLEAGAPLDAEQAAWLADGLRRYLEAGGELTLDAALFR
jgi:hypothetical protein